MIVLLALVVERTEIVEVFAPLWAYAWPLTIFFGGLIAALGVGMGPVWRRQSRRYAREQAQMLAALRESEARFHLMFEHHGAIMLLIEPHSGMIVDANQAAVTFYGLPKAALCAMSINALNALAPEQVAAERLRALHEERDYFVFPHTLADGAERIVEVYSSPISLQEKPLLFSIIHDITERRHTEELVYAQRDLAKFINSVNSTQAAWPLCLEVALRVSGMDSGGIYLFAADEHVLELVYHQGLRASFIQATTRHSTDTPKVQTMLTGKAFYFTSAELQQQAHSQQEGLQALASIPIQYQGRVLGAMNVASHTLTQVPAFARYALETIAAEIGNIVVYLRTEEALRRNAQILHDSQSIANLASWTADLQTDVFAANAEGSPMLAWITGTHTLDDLLALVHPDDQKFVRSAWVAAMRGAPYDLEYRVIVNDEVRWLYVKAKITYNQQRNPVSALGILQDVTERKLAELALRLSEEKYRGLMASLDSAIHAVDAEGRFLFINEVAAEQLGLTPPEVTGKTLHDLFPEPAANRQLERVRQVMCEDRKIISEWQGAFHGEARWYRTSALPIYDETGHASYVLVNSTDIHDLKLAQQALQELNQTLEERVRQRTAEVQDLYENAPNGYHSLDRSGNLSMVNQTELTWLGYTREEMLGRPFADFITPQSQHIFQDNYALFKQRGWVRGLEYDLIRKDGTTLHTLLDAVAVYDEHGTYVMSRSTMIDNTERKKAEETMYRANADLARAARTKDEFLANMSHELRTPLNAVLGLSEALQEQISGPLNERQLHLLSNIEASGRHLLMLINDILDLSKVEAGRLDLQIETVTVVDVCQSSLMFVKEQALKKMLQLGFQLDDQGAEMEADPRRLKQMLVNLLSNAVKFTPANGHVRLDVTTDAEAGVIRFAVQDNGIGIAPENLAQLFQPFKQLDSSLNRQHEGTGLGLALVRRLVELHGGSVTVESALGQGSCFTLSMPYRLAQALEETPPDTALANGETTSDPLRSALAPERQPPPTDARILLADDSEINLQIVRDYLQDKGYVVVIARTGHEVLDQAEAFRPDLILMDVQMPEMDGIEAIQRLRARPDGAATPIIALTARAMAGDRERCLSAGASVYLSKPVSLKGLVTMIERLLLP